MSQTLPASSNIVVTASAMAVALPALVPGISDDDLDLRPGAFVWDDPAPWNGKVSIFISLASQRAWVYRGQSLIGVAAVSTGKRGKETPVGSYSILQKRAKHRSNIYANAPMPFMQRLTWDGIALHAGRDPGFPASHGCVRLPFAFAQKLFGATELGAQVIVSRDAVPPAITPRAPAPAYLTVSRIAMLDSDVTAPIPVVTASARPHWVDEAPPAPWLEVDPAIFAIRRL